VSGSSLQPFRAYGNRRLRRAGAGGSPVRVTFDGAWLEFAGEQGAPLRLPVAGLERMRAGYTEGKGGPFYMTILWPAGEKPIKLSPLREDWPHYAAFTRALAARVAASHGPRAVERGDTQFGALLGPVLMGLLLAASLAVCVFALPDEPTLLRWVPAVLPALLFGLLYWRYQAVHRPRAVAELGELERQLPE